jgi:hypothetical protein
MVFNVIVLTKKSSQLIFLPLFLFPIPFEEEEQRIKTEKN